MKKNSTSVSVSSIPELTIGLDLSDCSFRFCELNQKGEIVAEGQAKLNRASLRRYLAEKPPARVALETGGHSAWVHEAITELGREAVWRMHGSCGQLPGAAIAVMRMRRDNWHGWRASTRRCSIR